MSDNRSQMVDPEMQRARVKDAVDYSRQTADPAGDESDAAEMVRALRRAFPHFWFWNDPQTIKRMHDELSGAISGQDTSVVEDARLEQSNPDPEVNPSADPLFGDQVVKDKGGVLRVRRDRKL